jgi:hypothetical protein
VRRLDLSGDSSDGDDDQFMSDCRAHRISDSRLQRILKQAVVGSNWCGFGSYRDLIDKLPLAPLAVSWDGGGHVWDPRRHTTPLRGKGDVTGGRLGTRQGACRRCAADSRGDGATLPRVSTPRHSTR